MTQFPRRTLVLMLLALVAFGWMWRQTHRAPLPPLKGAVATPVEVRVPVGGDR
jgi:hypothetical protein